jgi:hypothetical protein
VRQHIQAVDVDVECIACRQTLKVLAYAFNKRWSAEVYVTTLLQPCKERIALFLLGFPP